MKGELSVASTPTIPSLTVGFSCDGKAAAFCLSPSQSDVLITLLQRGLQNIVEGLHVAERISINDATLEILP